MITFLFSVAFLIVSYFVYGAYLDRALGIDPQREMPCKTRYDGVDYVPIPTWRVFLIQLLNIAGLGPVFGAIMGALWGPVVFIWIVLGGVFIGGVHDYVSAHISVREGGISLTGIIQTYLGKNVLRVMLVMVMALLVMVGAVFVMGPARIMADLFLTGEVTSAAAMSPDLPGSTAASGTTQVAPGSASPALSPSPASPDLKPFYATPVFWSIVIFIYYTLATLLPIDALIGRVYPFFGAAMLAMVAMIIWEVFDGTLVLPELSLQNLHPNGIGIWPVMMVTVTCGAISGFHATQSPMMARTLESERYSRGVFYGAMLTETLIALVWAGAAIGLFHGSTIDLKAALGAKNEAVNIVRAVGHLLGNWGTILILLGVVALPITTGDTAFRSARLILADLLSLDQKCIGKRLMISIPVFLIAFCLTMAKFDVIWGYFSWLNQTISVFTLWACTVYLRSNKRNYFITMLPALFMTAMCSSYIVIDAKTGFGMTPLIGNIAGALMAAACAWFALARPAPLPALAIAR